MNRLFRKAGLDSRLAGCTCVLLLALCAPPFTRAQLKAIDVAPCGVARASTHRHLAPIYSGTPSHATTAANLEFAFRESYTFGKAETAVNTARQVLATTTVENDICGQALASFLLAGAAKDLKDEEKQTLLQTTIQLFDSLHSPEGVGYSEFRLANFYTVRNKFDLGLEHYKKSEEAFDTAGDGYASLYSQITAADAQRSPDFAALRAKADALGQPCLQAEAEDSWANRAHRDGKLGDAILHGGLADSFFAHCPGSESVRAAGQTNLGRTEREQGRPFAALEHYRIALRLQRESGDASYIPQTYNAMAVAYGSMKDYRHSIPLLHKGLDMARSLHFPQMIEFLEANLGAEYLRAGQPRLGIPLLLDATHDLSSDRLRCARLAQLGKAYEASGDHGTAIENLSAALAACRLTQENERIIETLESLAEAENHAHRYEDALRDARENISLLDSTRAHVVAQDAYKQGFLNRNVHAYDNAIAALTALHRPAEALEVAEGGRARAFLDLLASRPIDTRAPPAPHTLDRYRKDLIDSPASADALTTEAALAMTARLHSTLLAYWLSADTLYLWIARPGEAVIEESRPISPRRLSQLVAATRLPSAPGTANAGTWRTLYRLLIAPVEAQLPPGDGSLLTIVPSGPLFALSFSALTSPRGVYFAERFRLHTIPSVGLLDYTKKNAEAAASKAPHFVLLSNPGEMPIDFNNHALVPLPGTSLEVNAIAKLLPEGQVTRLEGHGANVRRLRENLPGATLLHFATHAVLDDANPYNSFLALDDAKHEGRLGLAEIYALQLNSRLVVLSACSSGLGKVTGDGVDGMSRAFFYAGSAAVLNTLWDISDQVTATLLPRFYAGLMKEQPPSAALRDAQLSVLDDLRHHRLHTRGISGDFALPPDPTYWAAFSLVGEP